MSTPALPQPPVSVTTRSPASGSAHARRAANGQSLRRCRLAQTRARRDPGAELAARSRQRRRQRDDGDRLHDARLAVAPRARRRRARLQSSISRRFSSASAWSAALSPIAAARLGAGDDAGEPAARDAPGASLGPPHRRAPGSCCGRPARSCPRSASRRIWRATPEFTCAACNGGWRRTCCSSPPARVFAALERPRPTLVAGLIARRLQRARQLRADLRQVRHAGARDHRLGPGDHAVADADVR